MKVIYDISPVGNRPEFRTGVARAAWTTAVLLREKLGDQLSFAASGSISAAIQAEDLLHHHPELVSSIQPVNMIAKQVHQYQERLGRFQNNSNGYSAVGLSVSQKLLINFSRLLNITRIPIKRDALNEADLFHSPYARIPRQVRKALLGRHVLTVNDLTPLLLAEHYFVPGQQAITRRIIDSVQLNDWVITISESTRNDLCNHHPINPERVITVHLAASKELFYPVDDFELIRAVRQKYKIPSGEYLLTLHSLAPHKNLTHLIRSFQNVVKQEKTYKPILVVCGGHARSLDEFRKAFNLQKSDLDQVHFTGFVDDKDLAALYSGARAFVFPSLYEGFGLPVLEAMQCGCPVISSNTSSLPEIVGDAGILVAANDEEALSEAILKLCRDDRSAKQLGQSGKQRARLFSWEKTILETLNVYQRVVNERH